ncbi:hypothetical protein [Idiomarina aquatica]|uniref:Uncharacterized protein n=1 Tax=Idiomarina aquatica TaxID=1327752 RepID=A0AA94JCV8_9GAMM|nr:hypothetical protein [Idiomarina aquatica]RUO42590.1 hypothetical protein CWE23_10950 [Idiomarina aquatica]
MATILKIIAIILLLWLEIMKVSLAKETHDEKAEVIILGVSHSAQLFVKEYRPAVLRAWLAAAEPDVIAVELTQERFNSGNYYDFTHEIQGIIIPFADELGVSLQPFDWEPTAQDSQLMFGFDLFHTPLIRPSAGWRSFLSFSDEELDWVKGFHIADQQAMRKKLTAWMDTPVSSLQAEAARRLYLYRTFFQARNIEAIAKRNPGKRIVVVVGYMHQPDLERVLKTSDMVTLTPSSQFPLPAASTIEQYEKTKDLYAIAWANLFSSHAHSRGFDTDWLRDILKRIKRVDNNLEYDVLKLKYNQFHEAPSLSLLKRWRDLAESIPAGQSPSWRAGLNEQRIDSDFEPFSAMGLRARAFHEAAVVACRLKKTEHVRSFQQEVSTTLSKARARHYFDYWEAVFPQC